MFTTKQIPPPSPPSSPEHSGLEINVRLSEATLIKLIPVAAALLVGSGFLAHTQLVPPSPDAPPADTSVGQPS